MEKTNSRLHPLLTAAAISITVFSAVGVASLTGLVPQSIGSQKEAISPPVIETPEEVAKPVAKPARKPVARTGKPRQVEPVIYREFAEALRVVETPQPVVQPGNLGTVQAAARRKPY